MFFKGEKKGGKFDKAKARSLELIHQMGKVFVSKESSKTKANCVEWKLNIDLRTSNEIFLSEIRALL